MSSFSNCAGGTGVSLFFVVFFICWYGITGVMVYFGVNMVIEGSEYSQNATNEQCLLIEFEAQECSYSCNCDSDGENCSTCYGTEYEYIATVESKCDDQPLYSHDLDTNCPGALKNMGQEYNCYVLDCEEAEFSFASPGSRIGWGIALLAFSSIFVYAPCCMLFCMCKDDGCFCFDGW